MVYFNGFSLTGEKDLFSEYFIKSDTCVVGFSYGAQKAFEYAYTHKERIDRLILLSPAFFQTQTRSFVRTQLRYFKAGKDNYIEQFLKNVSYPSTIELSKYLKVGTEDELEALLTYRWDKKKIKDLIDKGIVIEIFLGTKDKIIDASEAYHFFSELTTNYLIKDVGHLLRN